MFRHEDPAKRKPERVVILDADDPMVEIHGEIVWREEHDRVVEEARQQAYEDGYAAGERDALSEQRLQPVQIDVRRRRAVWYRIRVAVLLSVVVIVCLMALLVLQNLAR